MRIEPDNPLLWIELAKVRQAEGNYVQTENLARKAVSMSINAPRTQSAAWQLIADSYRARGKNVEARDAQRPRRCTESLTASINALLCSRLIEQSRRAIAAVKIQVFRWRAGCRGTVQSPFARCG